MILGTKILTPPLKIPSKLAIFFDIFFDII